MQGEELTDLEALKAAGAIAISDDGVPVGSSRCLLEALEKAQKLGLTLTAHCEDMDLARGGKMNDGPPGPGAGAARHPRRGGGLRHRQGRSRRRPLSMLRCTSAT